MPRVIRGLPETLEIRRCCALFDARLKLTSISPGSLIASSSCIIQLVYFPLSSTPSVTPYFLLSHSFPPPHIFTQLYTIYYLHTLAPYYRSNSENRRAPLMAMTDNYILWSWAFFFMVLATSMSLLPTSPTLLQYERSGPDHSSLGLYISRSHWIPFLSDIIPEHAYHRLSHSFEGDIEAGLR